VLYLVQHKHNTVVMDNWYTYAASRIVCGLPF
jgi:hypothetical protein